MSQARDLLAEVAKRQAELWKAIEELQEVIAQEIGAEFDESIDFIDTVHEFFIQTADAYEQAGLEAIEENHVEELRQLCRDSVDWDAR